MLQNDENWKLAQEFVDKGCAMQASEAAGISCNRYGEMLRDGQLGRAIDPEVALMFFDRGCTFTSAVACVNGSILAASLEKPDFLTAEKLAKFGCDLATRAMSPASCLQLGDLYRDGFIGSHAAGSDRAYKMAFIFYEKGCDRSSAQACLAASQAGVDDPNKSAALVKKACEIPDSDLGEDTCQLKAAANQTSAAMSVDGQNLMQIIVETNTYCISGDGEACAKVSQIYLQDIDPPNLAMALQLARQACDFSQCQAIAHFYEEYGTIDETPQMTAHYVRQIILTSSIAYSPTAFGKLAEDQDYFLQVVKNLQASLGRRMDGDMTEATFNAIKRNITNY